MLTLLQAVLNILNSSHMVPLHMFNIIMINYLISNTKRIMKAIQQMVVLLHNGGKLFQTPITQAQKEKNIDIPLFSQDRYLLLKILIIYKALKLQKKNLNL